MLRHVSLSVAISAVFVASARSDPHEKDAMNFTIFRVASVRWTDAPACLPPGAKIAVLEGDPNKEGPFVFRALLPDGYRIAPHTHPKVERITVISGQFNVGMGDKFDASKTQAMPAGTYGFWPAGMKHFVWAKGETVVQFHGMGPWSIEYINPQDDPRKRKP